MAYYNRSTNTTIEKYIGSDYDTVKKVADNMEELLKISDSTDEMTAILEFTDEIALVGSEIDAVVNVSDHMADILTVNTNIGVITTVANDITSVVAVGNDIASVSAVHDSLPVISTVEDNLAIIQEVATGMPSVEAVAADMVSVVSVAEELPTIVEVAASIPDISVVSANIVDIETVATNISDVQVVADNYEDVGVLADAITSNTVALKTPEDTGAIFAPAGNSASRPSAPVEGMIRYNTETDKVEVYSSTGWLSLGDVISVNGQTGVITLAAEDVGAATDDVFRNIPSETNAAVKYIAIGAGADGSSQNGGGVFIAAGESLGQVLEGVVNHESEDMYLVADSRVVVATGVQDGWSGRKETVFNSDGSISIPTKILHRALSTANKQLINANSTVIYLGNPEVSQVNIETSTGVVNAKTPTNTYAIYHVGNPPEIDEIPGLREELDAGSGGSDTLSGLSDVADDATSIAVTGDVLTFSGGVWTAVAPVGGEGTTAVTSVNEEIGAVVLGASDVGAVDKTGDTMTDTLYVNSANGTGVAVCRTANPPGYVQMAAGGNETDAIFGYGPAVNSLQHYLRILDTGINYTNSDDTYTVYHTGNKPTAADVGALPITGGTLTDDLTVQPVGAGGVRLDAVSTGGSVQLLRPTGIPYVSFMGVADDYVKFSIRDDAGASLHDFVQYTFASDATSIYNPVSSTAQGTASNALVRKDYIDALTPADIGAAEVVHTHTHTEVGAAPDGFGLGEPSVNKNDADLIGDVSGFFAGGGSGALNYALPYAPLLQQFRSGGDGTGIVLQLQVDPVTGSMYTRGRDQGVWTPWIEGYSSVHKPTPDDISAAPNHSFSAKDVDGIRHVVMGPNADTLGGVNGGSVAIIAGECMMDALLNLPRDQERAYVIADGEVRILTNMEAGWGNEKTTVFRTDGSMDSPGNIRVYKDSPALLLADVNGTTVGRMVSDTTTGEMKVINQVNGRTLNFKADGNLEYEGGYITTDQRRGFWQDGGNFATADGSQNEGFFISWLPGDVQNCSFFARGAVNSQYHYVRWVLAAGGASTTLEMRNNATLWINNTQVTLASDLVAMKEEMQATLDEFQANKIATLETQIAELIAANNSAIAAIKQLQKGTVV